MNYATRGSAIRQMAAAQLPTKWGMFRTLGFERDSANAGTESALAIVLGEFTGGSPLVRIHSQCFTSEVLGSLRCDCNEQLEMAMRAIADEGRGIVIYEFQEGRGIGLMAKLQAYSLQDAGLDTVDANYALGFKADCRNFSFSVAILRELGVNSVRILTNNDNKVYALREAGIYVSEQIPCEARPSRYSLSYLRAKKERMGHALNLDSEESFEFATVETATEELKAGRMVVVVDDEDRENEGDLTIAAEMVTPEAINFMATYGRGLVCLAMTGERLDQLRLAPMVHENTALHETAFTISIDAITNDVTTGISSHDRARTIKTAIDASCRPEDLGRPGHVFPLRARNNGVLERRGQTEAAVDLARLAGLQPAGVICEIVNDDGTMARIPDLIRFCQRHNLAMITVAELARFRFDLEFTEFVSVMDGLVAFRETTSSELDCAEILQ